MSVATGDAMKNEVGIKKIKSLRRLLRRYAPRK
jgi:hypothetical protein